jgi:hypothetical protein
MKKLLCIFLFVASISCKKDNDKSPHQKDLDLITNRPWNIVFRGFDNNKDGVFKEDDVMENYLAECQLDDTFKFDANESYTVQPNTITNGCGTGSYTSSWKLHANSTDFHFDIYEGKVITLNDSVFHFKIILEDDSENNLIFKR